MPALVHYHLGDGPHEPEPTSERGEIERIARSCRAADCQPCLDRTVVETRFNEVRSSVPSVVETSRTLRDSLPPVDRRDPTNLAEAVFGEAATTLTGWSKGSLGTASGSRLGSSGLDVACPSQLAGPGARGGLLVRTP